MGIVGARLKLTPKTALPDEGKDFVRHFFAMQSPCCAIFFSAALVIAYGPIDEKDGEKYDVEVGENIKEKSRKTPAKGPENLG